MARRIAPGNSRAKHYIREWRVFRGLTQQDIADGLATTTASVSRIETGVTPYTQDFLEAVASMLQTTPAQLLERDPAQPREPEIWSQLTAPQREQAIRILKALVETDSA